MNIQELINTQKLELTNEYERIRSNLADSKEKLLKTEGALLLLQYLEKQIVKEN